MHTGRVSWKELQNIFCTANVPWILENSQSILLETEVVLGPLAQPPCRLPVAVKCGCRPLCDIVKGMFEDSMEAGLEGPIKTRVFKVN